jgi:hypothetical protein
VAVALHKRLSNYYHSHTIHDDHQLIHLRLKHLLPSDALLHVICWYLPCSGSTQLHAVDLMSRFTHLTSEAIVVAQHPSSAPTLVKHRTLLGLTICCCHPQLSST